MIRGENRKKRRHALARSRGGMRHVAKKNRTWSKKPVYKRRRRIAGLVLLAIVLMPFTTPIRAMMGDELSGTNVAAVEAVDPPLFSAAPAMLTRPAEAAEQPAPKDKTLYLTIPKLGVYNHTVRNDDSPSALDLGAIKLPSSGFPWQDNANTYIAGHRIGYRDTESYYEFLDLPTMKKGDEVFLKDANDRQYVYRVTKVFAVTPQDSWVTAPVPGRDMVTLQTCVTSVDDWWSIGQELMTSSPSTGRLIVQADRVN